jgi:predicted DNA-binding WGR domain protein
VADVKFIFIGWCNDGKHDKVWTSFEVQDQLFCAWGRRGAKLSFKNHGKSCYNLSHSRISSLEQQKRNKGYKEVVDKFLLFSMFPDFDEKVEEELLLRTMAGKVM